MENITVIIPIHKWDDEFKKMTTDAINNVNECRGFTTAVITSLIVAPKSIECEELNALNSKETKVFYHEGETDYCSQVNAAAEVVETKFFSILEVDDLYTPKWFKMFNDYLVGNEDFSVFLPLTIQHIVGEDGWLYTNEMALSGGLAENIGEVTEELLTDVSIFNVTGAVINKEDFIAVGKYKPSIQIAFNYELLLRFAKSKKRIMVVPKEGYFHIVGRKDSLSDTYVKTIPADDIQKWFALAKTEYAYKKDRNKGISKKTRQEKLK